MSSSSRSGIPGVEPLIVFVLCLLSFFYPCHSVDEGGESRIFASDAVWPTVADLEIAVCGEWAAPQPRPSFVAVEVNLEDIEWPPEDGDTFEVNWRDAAGHLDDVETIRFLGADTPEIEHLEMGWFEAQPYADEATDFVAVALAGAGTIEIVRLECTDPYMRTLAYVLVDGQNLSAELVFAGLAHANVDKYGHQGLVDEAGEVELADRLVDPLGDENPHDFRARMREVAKTGSFVMN